MLERVAYLEVVLHFLHQQMKVNMKVLVACETSGAVREAFKRKGHEVYSCDILPAIDNSPLHIQGDAIEVIYSQQWDMIIAHPPCTYLCNSGVSWLHKDQSRWHELDKASQFFKTLLEYNIPKICVENPIPHKYGQLPKYTQIIQPYYFGHPESKATCLWLKNLPKLKETYNVKQEMINLPKKLSQRIHNTPPSKDRWKERSRTYRGIAEAMADQWGN